MEKTRWFGSIIAATMLMACIAQKNIGVTFTESGKGAGIYSGLIDKTITTAPATLSSVNNAIATAITLLEFTVKENGSKDGYPLQIKELRFNNSGTADIADLRFVLEGPGSNNTVGTASGNIVTFKDFGDIIITDGDTTGKTYQLKVHVRTNIQGSLEDGQTVILKTSPLSDFDVAETSSNILQAVSTFQQSPSTAIAIVATELQGKSSFQFSTGNHNTDFSGTQSIYATDANGRIDKDFTGAITLSAHVTVCPNAAPGTLSSTDGGTLVHNAVQGIASWLDLKYALNNITVTENIRVRAQSGGVTDLCSAILTINP